MATLSDKPLAVHVGELSMCSYMMPAQILRNSTFNAKYDLLLIITLNRTDEKIDYT